MWYVNGYIFSALRLVVIGIINTMWYVNQQLELYLCDLKRGIIVTMWYVNVNRYSIASNL